MATAATIDRNSVAARALLDLGSPARLARPRGAVRDLGIDRTEAQRAVKIAAVAPEAGYSA